MHSNSVHLLGRHKSWSNLGWIIWDLGWSNWEQMAGPDPHKPSPLDKLVPLHSQGQTSIIECIYHFIKKPVLKRTYRMMWQFSTGTRRSWCFHTDGQPLWRMHNWCICSFRGRKCFHHRVGRSEVSWFADSPKRRKRRVCIPTGETQSGIIADSSFIKKQFAWGLFFKLNISKCIQSK